MSRIGDLGLLIGIFLIATQTNALDYLSVAQKCFKNLNLTIIGHYVHYFRIFHWSNGKIVIRYPIYLDSRCNVHYTPVSALIHAATMVTAGIYLVRYVLISCII